ncbi:hypothetical protein BA895_22485 [Humibacillus sp. DSM 29435]|nr:hypothetical protein BA895_22485 [Humibacillus sp. DSM 29435]
MTTSCWFVAPLSAIRAGDRGLAGGKGANLGELVAAGFIVPAGFVVSTRLYREALERAGLQAPAGDRLLTVRAAASLRSAIEAMTIPEELASQVRDAYTVLGEGPVAVRSSATAEDLPGAAFAGQQETFLQVLGADAVLEAVRGCWASLWAQRAVLYRERVGYRDVPAIAVVVQRMVASEFAGVAFTANPVSGVRDEVVIEASPGLGESVVSGVVTPEHVVVDGRGRIKERRAGGAGVIIRGQASGGVSRQAGGGSAVAGLDAGVVRELAGTAVRIAAHFGRPQDIEWAYDGGTLWVVQTRPLTALPPAPVKANRVDRAAGAVCAELVPTRPYPLDVTAWTVPGWFAILARMVWELAGVRIDVKAMFPESGGVVTQLLPPRPRPTWRTLTTPGRVRRRWRRYDPALWTRDPRFAAYEDRLDELAGQDPSAMSWSELMQVPAQVLDLMNAFVELRIDYLPAVAARLLRLKVLLALTGAGAQFWPLMSGAPTLTRAGNDALQAMAEQIRLNPQWRHAFTTLADDPLIEAVWATDTFDPLRAALRAWLKAFGHRETTSAALLCGPTWESDPQLLLGQLRALLSEPATPATMVDQRAAAQTTVVRRRRVRWTGTGEVILRAAAAAGAGMAFREDSHFHALRARPVLIRMVVEAGRRLHHAEVVGDPSDIYHLHLAELQSLGDPAQVGSPQKAEVQQLIRSRAATRAEFGQAPLISPATLNPGVRRPDPDALVSGTPGGGGQATGPVRVIREPHEFGRLAPGEVLVCPYTNPAWTPLFQRAAAVVADTGSFGSHAAIVAREYGIPVVMGTGIGTRVLSDGQRVRVEWCPR